MSAHGSSVFAVLLLFGCSGPVATGSDAPLAPTPQAPAADPELPVGDVELTGRLGSAKDHNVWLRLRLDTARPSGVITFGDQTYTLIEPKLELVGKRREGAGVRARYRLTYRNDLCEPVKPGKPDAQKWGGPCTYEGHQKRPVFEIEGEVLLSRQRQDGQDSISAIGTQDAYAIADAFSLGGTVKP